jgi:hypothetical protein
MTVADVASPASLPSLASLASLASLPSLAFLWRDRATHTFPICDSALTDLTYEIHHHG